MSHSREAKKESLDQPIRHYSGKDLYILHDDVNNQKWIFLNVYKTYLHLFQVGLRDYQDTKADVILKYSADEARNLKSYGEFPETVKINETVTFGEDGIDDDIEFDDVESSEEEGDGLGQGIDDIWDVSAGQKPVTPTTWTLLPFWR